jgi:glycosyltransferase involved in cell wall biosynthesis
LATAIAKLLDDEKYANDLAANAFVKVKMRYATDKVAERIEEALEKIVARWNS